MKSRQRGLRQPFVREADPREDHTITLTFESGERRLFDLKPYLATEVFGSLKDLDRFREVRVVHGSLEWPGGEDSEPGPDLAYDMLYEVSVPLPLDESEAAAAR